MRRASIVLIALFTVACDGHVTPGTRDAARRDGGSPAPDAGRLDGGPRESGDGPDGRIDSSPAPDASSPDAGPPGPPANRFGMGLVSPGSTGDLDLVADLAGPGGHVKMIFAGITRDIAGPDADWVRAVREAYERDLVPVIRMGPPWGDLRVRAQSDDGEHLVYTSLAAAYRRVVEGLPLRDGWPLYVEVHNEPNLCYEWVCDAGSVPGDWMDYQQSAHEYAALLRDVADAVHAIGDPRIRVINAGLAPGGARRCQCGGDGFEAGVTSMDYLREMRVQVSDIFDRLDAFASHSYPARGEGWGFFAPYAESGPGLMYFSRELEVVGRDLPVLMTETGWCVQGSRCADGATTDRNTIADWTVMAYEDVWLTDPRLQAIMPFMLRDAAWEDFAWAHTDGSPYPVYTRVRALRCETISGRCP